MNDEEMINRDLIFLDIDCDNQTKVFEFLSSALIEQGFVKESFLQAIIDRESVYPTALCTEPFSIAIPHTDPEHIEKPFVALARLDKPVAWRQMVSEEVTNVKMVFMLGFKRHSEYHIKLLQRLMDLFATDEFANKLMSVDSIENCYELAKNNLGNLEEEGH